MNKAGVIDIATQWPAKQEVRVRESPASTTKQPFFIARWQVQNCNFSTYYTYTKIVRNKVTVVGIVTRKSL